MVKEGNLTRSLLVSEGEGGSELCEQGNRTAEEETGMGRACAPAGRAEEKDCGVLW